MNARELLASATPRPWVAYVAERKIGGRHVWSVGRGGVSALDNNEADAKLAAQAVNEREALLDIAEQMEREHAHHHIPGTTNCHGCGLIARLDAIRAAGGQA